MTQPINYPAIDDLLLSPFRVLKLLYRTNPDLLSSPRCPYSDENKAFVQGMLDGVGSDENRPPSFLAQAEDPYEALKEQIALTLEDIREIERAQGRLDQRDRVQFLKAKPGLLEKLIELEERTTNLKTLSDHMKRVYAFVDKELTPDQRTALMLAVGAAS